MGFASFGSPQTPALPSEPLTEPSGRSALMGGVLEPAAAIARGATLGSQIIIPGKRGKSPARSWSVGVLVGDSDPSWVLSSTW